MPSRKACCEVQCWVTTTVSWSGAITSNETKPLCGRSIAPVADTPFGKPICTLTQRHTDLKNEFYELVKARGATPNVEVRLRAEIAKLKKTIANKNKELKQVREDVPALVRAVHQLTLENQELRAQLDLPELNVTPLRRRR
ncbi:hypothetical protein GCM10022419_119080 [Nonomuraea rosea]|uniref:Uncharacterized protein n=2 Tax=Nonomuraea rosea TaxID=638574 RepID=A0ABP6ZM25_9ACTN